MSALVGALVDVSRSMKQNSGERRSINGEDTSWARSIFTFVDELIKNDVSSSNQVFAIAFGADNDETPVFDLLNTLKKYQPSKEVHNWSKRKVVQKAVEILKSNGALNVDKWATIEVLEENISQQMARILYSQLQGDPKFLHYFVYECLPEVCRSSWKERKETARGVGIGVGAAALPMLIVGGPIGWMAVGVSAVLTVGAKGKSIGKEATSLLSSAQGGLATSKDVREVIEKAKKFFVLEPVSRKAVISAQDASHILHGYTDKEELTDERIDALMDIVESFIYGGTPMIQAMNDASTLFSYPNYGHKEKLLFILSDGMPTDGHDPPTSKLAQLDVKIFSCFITDQDVNEPKRLYSKERQEWSRGAKFMFHISSMIQTEKVPRTVFVKRDWKIDITNNETKLFLQINHPDVTRDACSFAKDIVCYQEALSDVLANVSLDLYINQANKNFDAESQEEATCYANASATVLHLAMQRIIGREGGYPDFFELRREMIEDRGLKGANTLNVLQEMCKRYRLHVKRVVDLHGALKAVSEKRPVVARFSLTAKEREIFNSFFKVNPKGILTTKEIHNNRSQLLFSNFHGHAVVLTSYNSESLQLMNSRGTNWGNNGFFRVQNEKVLGLQFFDIYWELQDLTHSEKLAYETEGPNIAAKLVKSLKGLQRAEYECPLCSMSSLVSEFEGSLTEARCPKCKGTFDTKEKGNVLALNMYLLSTCSRKA